MQKHVDIQFLATFVDDYFFLPVNDLGFLVTEQSITHRCMGLFLGFQFYSIDLCMITQLIKILPPMQETTVRFLGREDPLEKGQDTHSNILAWRIPWTILSVRSQRIGHD